MSVFSSAFKSLYMHMCVCVESWKRGLALSITKRQGVHTAYNSVKEGKKERQRRDETEQYASPSLLSQLALTFGRKAFHRCAAWSKREFVQSNFILTFLAFFSSKHNPPTTTTTTAVAWQTNSTVHAVHRSLCIGDMSTMNQKEAGHRSNGNKGH